MKYLNLSYLVPTLLFVSMAGSASALEVTTAEDQFDTPSGNEVSLREAIRDSVSPETITFAEGLSGETIRLNGSQITINKNLVITGEGLPGGITVDAGSQSRIFEVNAGSLEVRMMTFTGGLADSSTIYPDNGGGAIYLNPETVFTAKQCLFIENSGTQFGGAISNNEAILRLEASTFFANQANFQGGAIHNFRGTATITHCTFTGGSATRGGALYNEGTLSLADSIVAENSATIGVDIENFGASTITASGSLNIIGDNSDSGIDAVPGLIGTADSPVFHGLAPLAFYGGPTRSMHPLAGSPAILDTADVTRTDQRGFNLTGPPTIGAVAIGNITTVTTSVDSLPGSLRSALAAATTPGAIIRFNDSLEGSSAGIIGLTSQLVIPATANGLFIDGSNFTDGLTIDANGTVEAPRRVMEIQPGATAALHGLTLTGGLVSGNGGAILNDQATLSLSACTLSGNSAGDNGGGIFSDGRNGSTTLSLSSCTLSSNSAVTGGGGIFGTGGDEGSATLSLSACTLSDNSASSGGGVLADSRNDGSTTLSLSSCTLSGNSASNEGGGIFNDARIGGTATLNLSACTLSGNSSQRNGGGISSDARIGGTATLNLNACTLSGNSAGIDGGGIFGHGIPSDDSGNSRVMLSLRNTILAGNSAPAGPDLRELGDGATSTATGNNVMSSLDGQNSLSDSEVTIVTDPMLAPLGHFGGPTQTMHPLAGSPAILDTEEDVTRTDQRGFNLTGPPTIGAVAIGNITTVTTSFSLGVGSLPSALAAATTPGAIIRFNDSLEGFSADIIALSSPFVIPATANGLFIDGSNFTDGLTIDANGTVEAPRRVMEIRPGATAALHGLTLTGGLVSGNGGAILNDQATLSLSACTLSGNSAGDNGGGIFSDGRNGSATLSLSSCTLSSNSAESAGGGIFGTGGDEGSVTLSLSACTLSGNSADFGGGIFSDARNSGSATLSLSACTLSGNSAESRGGGIFGTGNDEGSATLSLSACTLSGNSANFGGGIYSDDSGNGRVMLSLRNTILAGNSAPVGPDLRELGDGATSTATGSNLMSSLAGQSSLDESDGIIVTDPMLSPLGDFGGPTQTMPPLPGSPAIDAAGNSTTVDQRGFPIVGVADIGAVELQGTTFADEPQLFFFSDDDGDGTSNGVEQAIGSDPAAPDPLHPNKLQQLGFDGNDFQLQFGYADTTIPLTLTRSIDLINFEEIAVSGDDFNTGPDLIFIEDSDPPEAKAFYRLEATRPE